MFYAGVALGMGLGLVIGLGLGQFFMSWGFRTMQQTIDKVHYSLKYPSPPSDPVQGPEIATERAFDPQEMDTERIPDWMDEDYPMPMRNDG